MSYCITSSALHKKLLVPVCRLYLAALDHNTNVNRQQAMTRDGQLCYNLQYSKAAGAYVIVKQMQDKDYSFRLEIMTGIVHKCSLGTA